MNRRSDHVVQPRILRPRDGKVEASPAQYWPVRANLPIGSRAPVQFAFPQALLRHHVVAEGKARGGQTTLWRFILVDQPGQCKLIAQAVQQQPVETEIGQAVGFDDAYTFKFSLRDGTPATRFPGDGLRSNARITKPLMEDEREESLSISPPGTCRGPWKRRVIGGRACRTCLWLRVCTSRAKR